MPISTFEEDGSFEYGHNTEPAQEKCSGTVECSACKKFHGWCDEVEAKLKGETMLPNADQSDRSSGRRNDGGQRKSNRLRAEDLSTDKRDAKILAVKADPDGRYGAQVIAKIAVNGEVKFWYLDIKKNPNYKLLVDKLGHDENNWPDTRIQLDLEKDDFSDNMFIRVHFPEATKSSRK